ncbi:MAG: acyl-CoA thioesterase [Ruminobacter sp.]|uniref:acyl-CoA thioesterase n=1 Tax=Ruminobacter sp. TaxID=2774296 RepID=UPI001B4662C6|nr:hotdog domain-containing protein [Ruminobacter sp.]MBP3749827.1 acyl-CoA thioesterase [Ruminobacter sp.]
MSELENCNEKNDKPEGMLILRTMSMPANANPNGDVFGGWLMSQLDAGGAMMAYELTRGKVVTVAVDEIVFRNPVHVGDVVCVYGRVVHIGTTSIKIQLELWRKRNTESRTQRVKVTECGITYVAVDDNGIKRTLPHDLRENRDQIILNGYDSIYAEKEKDD